MINLKKSCDYRLQFIAHKGDVWELNFQLQSIKINQNNQQKTRIILWEQYDLKIPVGKEKSN